MSDILFWMDLPVVLSLLALLVVGFTRLKRKCIRAYFTILMLVFLAINIMWLLENEPEILTMIGINSSILPFPLATLIVLAFLYPMSPEKQIAWSFLLILPALAIGVHSSFEGLDLDTVYESPVVILFAFFCTSVGVTESARGWLSSRIVRSHCYFLSIALLALLITGPLYYFEFKFLGFQGLGGASLGAPVVGTFLLVPLIMANPLPLKKSVPSLSLRKDMVYNLKSGTCYAVSEKRPKYCYTLFRDVADAGYDSLLVTSSSSKEVGHKLMGGRIATLSTKDSSESLRVTNLGRILFTVSDFIERKRKPVVLIECLHYLISNNDLLEVAELLHGLVRSAKRKGGWLIVSFSMLSREEKAVLLSLDFTHLRMPQPERMIEKVLTAHVGKLSAHLLKLCGKMKNKRVQDIVIEDIPDISGIVVNSMRALGKATNDDAILMNWEIQCRGIKRSLDRIQRSPIGFLASGKWQTWDPLRREIQRRPGTVVRNQRVAPRADEISRFAGLHDAVKSAFDRSLGEFGRNLMRTECDGLGIKPGEMTSADVEMLAEKAAETVNMLGDFVDIVSAEETMKSKAESLREELERISREELIWSRG